MKRKKRSQEPTLSIEDGQNPASNVEFLRPLDTENFPADADLDEEGVWHLASPKADQSISIAAEFAVMQSQLGRLERRIQRTEDNTSPLNKRVDALQRSLNGLRDDIEAQHKEVADAVSHSRLTAETIKAVRKDKRWIDRLMYSVLGLVVVAAFLGVWYGGSGAFSDHKQAVTASVESVGKTVGNVEHVVDRESSVFSRNLDRVDRKLTQWWNEFDTQDVLSLFGMAATDQDPQAAQLAVFESSLGSTNKLRAAPARSSVNAMRELIRTTAWWREQPADNLTIQLVTVHTEAELYWFLQAHPKLLDKDIGLVKVEHEGINLYAIVQGSYNKRIEAEAGLRILPPDLRTNLPWIRPLGEIKSGIL